MAHFAQIDTDGNVLQVIVVVNDEILENGVESEAKGIKFCKTLFGEDTNWLQTSYNSTIRKNFAGIGYTYDANRDAFIPPKIVNSWVLDEQTCQWIPPKPKPNFPLEVGQYYQWNEDEIEWSVITLPIEETENSEIVTP